MDTSEEDPMIKWTNNKAAATPTPPPAATVIPTAPLSYPSAPTAVPASAGTCNYTMAYVADVTIPDGQPISAGSGFTKTWRLKNTGNCAWGTDFMFVFVSGSQMNGANRYLPYVVNPGDTVDISIDMIAPTTGGTYQGYWQLRTPQGYGIGFNIWVKIYVPGAYSYDTPEPEYYYPTSVPSYSYPTATPIGLGPTWIESESKWFATMAAGLPTLTPTPNFSHVKPIATIVSYSEVIAQPDYSSIVATVASESSGLMLSDSLGDFTPVHIMEWGGK